MGARKGISGGKCSPWCAIKEKLDSLWDKTHNAFTHVNGYEADGSQNLRINGSEGVIVETISGNEIRLIGAAAEPYVAEAPIVINPDSKTVSINIDGTPVSGSGNAISSGGVYAADQALQANISAEALARSTADGNLQSDLDAETAARSAADTALGGRIDNVINGTTPPATISGILPIQNGGTGSSTQSWVGITGNQYVYGQKSFIDGLFGGSVMEIGTDNSRAVYSISNDTDIIWFDINALFINQNGGVAIRLHYNRNFQTAVLYLAKRDNSGVYSDTAVATL